MRNLNGTLLRLVILTFCITLAGWSQTPGSAVSGKHVMVTRNHLTAPEGAVRQANILGNNIIYHGGPLMLGTVNVYYIWYGNWSGAAALSGMTLLQNLVTNFNGSTYYNINTTYYDSTLTNISNSVTFGGAAFDNYSQGTSINDGAVDTIVANAITTGQVPNDPNGAYFVLTSSDVDESTGFCTAYCGWHNHDSSSGTDIKFAFVGNPESCLSACAAQNPSPNGDAGIDGMASIIAHELAEMLTDPDINAWFDTNGNEMADKCAWMFGNTFFVGNQGAQANVTLGGVNYLLQQLWVNETGFSCALAYGTPPPALTLTGISPANGTQGAVVPVVLTGTGFAANSTVAVSGTGVSVSGVSVVSTTQIKATLTISPTAPITSYNVTVTASGRTSLPRTFSVLSLNPTLTSVSPSSGAPGANVPVTLTGTNFIAPVTVIVSGSGVTPASVNVVSSTSITATFQIDPAAALAGYSVSVQTTNGTSGGATFTVAQPTPTLTSISPSSASLNSATAVTLTGTNFTAPATINIAGSGVTASNVSLTSSTQISATINVASGATTGTHNVSVSTPVATTSSVAFSVNGNTGGGGTTPSIVSISPSSGAVGTTIRVTINGRNLTNLSAIPIFVTGSGVAVSSVTPVGTTGTTISATFTIAATATKSTRFVSVKNSTGTSSNTLPFTVH